MKFGFSNLNINYENEKNIHMSSPELNLYIMKDICYDEIWIFKFEYKLWKWKKYSYVISWTEPVHNERYMFMFSSLTDCCTLFKTTIMFQRVILIRNHWEKRNNSKLEVEGMDQSICIVAYMNVCPWLELCTIPIISNIISFKVL